MELSDIDEPLALPFDSPWPKNSPSNYTNVQSMLDKNQCFRTSFPSTIRNAHGYFLGPDTFNTTNSKVPIFSQAKTHCFWDLTFPMNYHVAWSLNRERDLIPWERKENVLFWRGSTTGGSYTKDKPWKKYHRTRLVQWARNFAEEYPDAVFDAGLENPPPIPAKPGYLVDIGFSRVVQYDNATLKAVKKKYPLKKKVDPKKAFEFKYLVVVDGNTWPERLQSYLQSNSVVLYNGIFFDYYMWMLIPWVHYVPIKLDMSDMDETMEWLVANDDKARQINENARDLMNIVNRIEQTQCYAGLLLLEYARLYREKVFFI
ncbi:capsule-associated protein CAP1 [Rhizoclosmatium sp. JEL0117]|nr:capsule-associated protein CAP1 [Rhizoclosmatium sp. JEL0117]